jgi:hypothetical protein
MEFLSSCTRTNLKRREKKLRKSRRKMNKPPKSNVCSPLTPLPMNHFLKKKGTRMLKEILKIDSPDTRDSKNDMKKSDNEATVSSRRDERGVSAHPKPSKKLSKLTPVANSQGHVQKLSSYGSLEKCLFV